MFKSTTKFLAITGGVAVLALAIGVMALGFTTRANAQAAEPNQEAGPTFNQRGGPGRPGMPEREGIVGDEFLAEALGISVEELQSAQDEVREAAQAAALEQAVEAGLLTQEQADALKSLGMRLPFRFKGADMGRDFGAIDGIDRQALLAEALDISVEELQAAQEAAQAARLEQAVADGKLTEEDIALMEARQALKDYIDPQAITAEALGLSVEELQSYREDGTSMPDILSELDLTFAEFRTAIQDAHQAAIEQAVDDGVITQEQADQLSDFGGRKDKLFDLRGDRPDGHRPGRGMPFGFPQADLDGSGSYPAPTIEGASL